MKRTILRRSLLLVLVLASLLQTTIGAFYPYDTENESLTEEDLEVITLMADLNIMHGDGLSFRPHDTITREEMFRVIYAISVGGSNAVPKAYYSEKLKAVQGLADLDDVSSWALPYAGYCFFNKLFVGNAYGELAPKHPVSYYDCAIVLLKLLGLPSSALGPEKAMSAVAKFGLAVGLFDDLAITDVYAPMTRLDVARMISVALESNCIAEIRGDTIRYAAVDGLRRWFGVSSVEKLRKSGVVTGLTNEKGEDYLVVSSGKNTLHYPAAGVSFGDMLGKIVCWTEKSSGEILSPIRSVVEQYTSSLRDLPSYRLQNGGLVLGNDEAEFVFDRNLLSGRNVWLYNTVTAELDRSQTFLTVSSLLDYLQTDLGARWGEDTVISLSSAGNDLVVRLTPLTYLRYDREAQTVGLNGIFYPTDETFAAVPDGAVVAVLLDKAEGKIVLHGLPALVDVSSKAFRTECDENGNYSFFLNDEPVRNRTELTTSVSDAELAAWAGVSGKMIRYILCDGDGIVGVGEFDEYRIPFTDVSAYIFVERTEKLMLGSRNYTAIFGFVNGKPGCELIDDAFGVPTLGENRLLYLSVETTPLGESAVRPQGVSSELDGLYGSTGFGTVTKAVFASGSKRTITVGETELLLTDDCAVACADADGTPNTFRLEDILIYGGRAYDDQAGRTFRAVYGVNADGAAEWLLLVRSTAN